MKALAIFIAAIAVAVAATVYIQWPVGHIPTYDAKCLVAYLMTLDQSHPLKEAKAPATVASAPAKEAKK